MRKRLGLGVGVGIYHHVSLAGIHVLVSALIRSKVRHASPAKEKRKEKEEEKKMLRNIPSSHSLLSFFSLRGGAFHVRDFANFRL